MEQELARIDVTGMKQVLRAVEAGKLKKVFVADDADAHIREKILSCCAEHGTEAVAVPSMKELGKACGISVGAACAGIRA